MVQFASSSGIVDSFRNAVAWGQQQQQYRNQLAQDAALRDALGKLPADATLDQEWQALRQGYSAAPGGGSALARMAMGQLQYQRALDVAKARGDTMRDIAHERDTSADARARYTSDAATARTHYGVDHADARSRHANEAKAHELLGAALEKNDPAAVRSALDFAQSAGVHIEKGDIDYYRNSPELQRASGFLTKIPDGDYKNRFWDAFQQTHRFDDALQAAGAPPAQPHAGARASDHGGAAASALTRAQGDYSRPDYAELQTPEGQQKFVDNFKHLAGDGATHPGGLDPQNPLALPPVGQNRLGLQRPGAKAPAPAPAAAAAPAPAPAPAAAAAPAPTPAPALVPGGYDGSQDEADQQQQDDEDDALLYGQR